MLTLIGDIAILAAGLAAGVYFHDGIVKAVKGTSAFAADLRVKAAKLEASLRDL